MDTARRDVLGRPIKRQTCECGRCPKCYHRELVARRRSEGYVNVSSGVTDEELDARALAWLERMQLEIH